MLWVILAIVDVGLGLDLGRDRLPLSGRRRASGSASGLSDKREGDRGLGRGVASRRASGGCRRPPVPPGRPAAPAARKNDGIVVHASAHGAWFDATVARARRAPAARRPPRADGVPRASPRGARPRPPRVASSSSSAGTGTSVGTRQTSRRIVSEWCETLRCRSRGSAKLIRRAGIGRPPSAAAAFSALPLAERADAPRGVGAQVPGTVGHDDHVRTEHLLRGEHRRSTPSRPRARRRTPART